MSGLKQSAKKIVRQKTTTKQEDSLTLQLVQLFKACPIPDDEIIYNLGLFLTSRSLSRILLMDFLYRQIIQIHGEVLEFGTRWGQNYSLFAALRGIYEPFNRHRKVVCFDTFSGLQGVTDKDGRSDFMRNGSLSVNSQYDHYLEKLSDIKDQFNPIPHFKKYEIKKGLAEDQLKEYFNDHPETIVSLAFFDMDIYKPTKDCLEMIKDRVTKGSVIAFDELNESEAPGETTALKEVFGLSRYSIKRYQYAARVAYIVIE